MRTAIVAALLFAVAQPPAPTFAGSWTAALGGQIYARVELAETNGSVSGQISLGAVHFDSSGAITEVMSTARNFTPIFGVTLRDGVLSFARRDGTDVDRFEMRVANGEGRLTFLPRPEDRAELASQGIATLQPVALTRAKP